MTQPGPNIVRDLAFAAQCSAGGNLAAAEVIFRNILDADPEQPQALHGLGMIAAALGMRKDAIGYFKSAAASGLPEAKGELGRLRTLPKVSPASDARKRFLVIRAWGYGFWSDVSHVLGALLLAEITGRLPIVHWGRNSLFGDGSDADAFTRYFEPISELTLSGLPEDKTFYPPKWTSHNLTGADNAKWTGSYSRMAGLYFFSRPETIAVCDFHIAVLELLPWLQPKHPIYGETVEAAYRYLIGKYIKPRPAILDRVRSFAQEKFPANDYAAIHIRGSDKVVEDRRLAHLNESYWPHVDKQPPGRALFVMSDDERLVGKFQARYSHRVVTTDSERTMTDTGTHHQIGGDGVRRGTEMMIDTYLALGARHFIGNGSSNVSAFVALLKDWQPGTCTLLAPSILRQRNLFIHIAR
jgi:hypothetical protein